MRLSAKGVDALSTEKAQEDFWDALTPGLCLRVSGRTGRKTWLVRYRANGTHRRHKLGLYDRDSNPEMGVLSLADARKAAREAMAQADAGDDPAEEPEEATREPGTFQELAEEVLEAKKATTRPTTQEERARILRTYLSAWEDRPAGSISRRDVRQRVREIAKGGAPVMGNRVLAFVKLVYNEALDAEFPGVEANPATRMKPIRPERSRRRYLDRAEIRTVWQATEPENPVTRGIFRLTLLTAARVGSVCSMKWADIDDADVWRIPAKDFKGRRPHMVPLSSEARAVLATLYELTGAGEYVFPGRADGAVPHITSMNKALQRIRNRSKLPRWTIHDFRRTFRTWATRSADPSHPKDPTGLGIAPHVADAVLGHKEASLGFDKYTAEPERYLLAEKREALERWGGFVGEAVRARHV